MAFQVFVAVADGCVVGAASPIPADPIAPAVLLVLLLVTVIAVVGRGTVLTVPATFRQPGKATS